MATKFLDKTGLSHFWSKIKTWCNAVFAPIAHTHTSYDVKHSYTVAANAAKNWYRIANASTQQLDISKPIHAQFILTAYNTSYASDYYERWFVNVGVFGRTANIVIFGATSIPFSQARVLYENTVANIDANDRPALDIYLNYVLPNGTTKIEIEEVYNNGGWTFLADGQLATSTVPSGFESVACSVRNNGVERSTYADYVSYLNRQVSNITTAFTLADSYLYRSRTLNCTGTFTITIPSINSGYMWCVIKNKNTSSGVITLHPSTTSVLIDGSNADITLQPMEYVCIHSAGANNYSLIADGRFSSKTVAIANKVGTTTVGTSDAPIYLNAGVPTVTGGRLNRSLAQYVAADGYSDVFQTYQSDNNNYRSCTIRCTNGNGFNEILLGAHNENNAAPSGITVKNTNGVITATAPAPATDANDTRIATTKWVNDKGYITSSGSITGNAATASAVAWSGITDKPNTFFYSCMVGQSTASGTNPWYKVATAEITNANDDVIAVFLVESTYGVHGYGLLQVHIRTESDIKVNTTATTFQWLSYTGINPSNFVLVCPTVASPTVEIWSKISYGYMFKRFTILSEGNRYSTTSIWTLLNVNSAGQHASITTSGTQFVSQLTGLANNVTGTVAIANGGTEATTRLGAIGNFFYEGMTTSNTKSFLVINDSFANAGWLSVGDVKNVLGLNSYLPLTGGILTGTLYSHYIRHKISGIDITNTTSGYVQDIPFIVCDKNNKDLTALLTYRYHSEGKTVQTFRVNNKNGNSADFRFEVNDNNSFVCYATASSGMKDATSFNDDGWTYVTANWVRRHNRIVCNYGPDLSKPYNCIVKTDSRITASYADRSIILLVEKPYTIAGGLGICQVSLRTNDSNTVAACTARWLARTGNIAANCIQVGLINTPGSAACDIYYNITGGYETAHITVLAQSSGRYSDPNKASGGFVPFAATDDNFADRQFASMNAGAQHYWNQNYSSTTYPVDENVVNSTTNSNVSDERFKSQISLLPENILDAWDEVDFCQFKFNEAAESKGLENARLHSGLIAQQIDTIFRNHDLDASTYGFFCCDSQYEEVETQDANGNVIRNLVKVSDLYSIRYTEALCIEAAYQRYKNKILENHISELEKRLTKLEGNV